MRSSIRRMVFAIGMHIHWTLAHKTTFLYIYICIVPLFQFEIVAIVRKQDWNANEVNSINGYRKFSINPTIEPEENSTESDYCFGLELIFIVFTITLFFFSFAFIHLTCLRFKHTYRNSRSICKKFVTKLCNSRQIIYVHFTGIINHIFVYAPIFSTKSK